MPNYVLDVKHLGKNLASLIPLLILDIFAVICARMVIGRIKESMWVLIGLLLFVTLIVLARVSFKVTCFIICGGVQNLTAFVQNIAVVSGRMNLYFGIRKSFMDSIKNVERTGSPENALKLNLFGKLVSVFAIYPVLWYCHDKGKLGNAIASVKELLEKEGKSLLARFWFILPLQVVMLVCVVLMVTTSFEIAIKTAIVYVVIFYAISFLELNLLSELEMGNSSVEFSYEEGMGSKEVSNVNIITVNWYTNSVFSDSLHILFKKEGSKQNEQSRESEESAGNDLP